MKFISVLLLEAAVLSQTAYNAQHHSCVYACDTNKPVYDNPDEIRNCHIKCDNQYLSKSTSETTTTTTQINDPLKSTGTTNVVNPVQEVDSGISGTTESQDGRKGAINENTFRTEESGMLKQTDTSKDGASGRSSTDTSSNDKSKSSSDSSKTSSDSSKTSSDLSKSSSDSSRTSSDSSKTKSEADKTRESLKNSSSNFRLNRTSDKDDKDDESTSGSPLAMQTSLLGLTIAFVACLM